MFNLKHKVRVIQTFIFKEAKEYDFVAYEGG
jgi:hypothetical protein